MFQPRENCNVDSSEVNQDDNFPSVHQPTSKQFNNPSNKQYISSILNFAIKYLTHDNIRKHKEYLVTNYLQ